MARFFRYSSAESEREREGGIKFRCLGATVEQIMFIIKFITAPARPGGVGWG